MGVMNVSDADVNTRRAIARNPGSSPRDLKLLVNDEDTLVRLFVGINPNTPEDVKEDIDLFSHMSGHREIYGLWAEDADSGAWDDNEWMYRVGSGDPEDFEDHSVIFNEYGQDKYANKDPYWWTNTLRFIQELDFASGIDEFLDMYLGDEDDQDWFDIRTDDDWRDALIGIYDSYKKNGKDSLQFKFDAVQALYPYTDFRQVNAEDRYSNGRRWVTIFYDWDHMDSISEDELATWYFWQVSEARAKYLDLDSLTDTDYSDVEECDLWDLFDRFGECTDDWSLITDEELEDARNHNRELEFLANELGYNVNYCVLV